MKKYLCLILSIQTVYAFGVTPFYNIRSQSENKARELVGSGWNTHINLCCMDDWYGNLSITPEYTRTFRPCTIAQSLFGCIDDCCPSSSYNSCSREGTCNSCCQDKYAITISGSQVDNRGSHDWLAEYFGLPTDYQSCVTFEPRIDTFLVDFNLYLGLDAWCEGLYFNIHAPVVHTRWDLNMCETITNQGTNDYWPGYFNETFSFSSTSTFGVANSNLISSFSSFINGCSRIDTNEFTFSPLCNAKMSCCDSKKTALSDIQMALGYNYCCDDNYHIGFNLRAASPTGTRPSGNILFEPIVGNSKHWELGAGLSTHWKFWQNECECKSLALYLDTNVTHLFKTKQCRTFDLCGKPLSRYMLAAKFKTPVDKLKASQTLASEAVPPSKQFAGIYSPLANLTTFDVNVSVGAQADLALMLQYIHNCWSCDIGYNFWARSCEKIEHSCHCCHNFEDNTWGLKGDAFMYGFTADLDGLVNPGIALSATQSKATIFNGTNNYPEGDTSADILYEQNPGIDNRRKAFADDDELFNFTKELQLEINTSLNPALINLCDIDLNGARTKGRSHKFFMNIDYTWQNYECTTPYLGIGFEVECAQKPCQNYCDNNSECCSCNTCNNNLDFSTSCINCYNPLCSSSACCNCCSISAASQWGIWIKGGLGF